jgi:hypothetical protein
MQQVTVVTSTPTSGATFTVDNTSPTAAITYSSAAPYKNGETVTITATFNGAVLDSPVPTIAIAGSGIANVTSTNMTKVSTTVYTYSYAVPTGDGTGTVTVGTGTDAAGNVVTSTPTSGLHLQWIILHRH